jgi:Holliday junction resolvase RusA-like endonuclease
MASHAFYESSPKWALVIIVATLFSSTEMDPSSLLGSMCQQSTACSLSRWWTLLVFALTNAKQINNQLIKMAAARTPSFVSSDDFDALLVDQNDRKSVYVTVQGSPPVQARPRVTTIAGRGHFYDPCARSKRAFKRGMRKALQDLGIHRFPMMNPDAHLRLRATFFLSNEGKDMDNLLKYLMDALTSIIYANDAIIFDVEMKKVPIGIRSQFTRFEIEELV